MIESRYVWWAREGVEPRRQPFQGRINNLSDFRWPPKYLRSRERHENRRWKSWVQNISLAKAVVLVRIDPQPQAMKISLIGARLFFRGQLDEICPHSVSELRTL